MIEKRITALDEAIKAAGIPIDGVALLRNGSVRIDFQREATPQQRQQAQVIVDNFDFRPRRARQLVTLSQEFNALSSGDFKKALCYVLAKAAAEEPRFPRRLGIPIDGDEPES